MKEKAIAFLVKVVLMAALFIGVIALCSSCRTTSGCEISYDRMVDTVYINKTIRDSVMLHDSVYESIYVVDDTFVMYKYKQMVQYRDRYVHDTIYKVHNDTIYQYKEKVVTQKEGLRGKLKTIMVFSILIGLVFFIVRYFKG